jgi:fimbrial chaperone protein
MRPTLLAALTLLACVPVREVRAAAWDVSPVLVTFDAGETATTIEMTNHSGAPASIQARGYRWTQKGDEDALTPTQDVIVSPPIFTVPDGGLQTMRVLLRGGSAAGGARTYRLILDEVPPAARQNREIAVALRLSLPVFVGADPLGRPLLQWRVGREPGGQTVLSASNAGPGYDRVRAIDVTLSDGSHPKLVSRASNTYILAGDERHWVVQDRSGAPTGPLHLSVTSRTGKSELSLAP